jgi:hypothetical protein
MCVVCLDTSIASSRQHCCDAFRSTIVPMAALPNPNKRLFRQQNAMPVAGATDAVIKLL